MPISYARLPEAATLTEPPDRHNRTPGGAPREAGLDLCGG
jgi:hypothetical protein